MILHIWHSRNSVFIVYYRWGMLYMTIKWLAPTWEILCTTKQMSVLHQTLKTFSLRWYSWYYLKANSDPTVLYVHQTINFSSWGHGQPPFPSPLTSRRSLMINFSQSHVNRQHWPQILAPKSSGVLCKYLVTPLSSLVIWGLKQRNDKGLHGPKP